MTHPQEMIGAALVVAVITVEFVVGAILDWRRGLRANAVGAVLLVIMVLSIAGFFVAVAQGWGQVAVSLLVLSGGATVGSLVAGRVAVRRGE